MLDVVLNTDKYLQSLSELLGLSVTLTKLRIIFQSRIQLIKNKVNFEKACDVNDKQFPGNF